MNLPILTIFLVLVILMGSSIEYDFVFANNNTTTNGEVIIRCIKREREALLTFKEGLIDKYGITSSWGSRDKECCKWEGVQCSNTTGHVVALQRNGFLRGEINSALLELHNLKVLDLGGNKFNSTKFPEFICFMTQLQHLNLNESNFVGILPSQLWNLTNLRTLDLSYNYFSGSIPPEIGNLINLESLHLSSNEFSGTLPSEIRNLTNLERLHLAYNKFSGTLPSEIRNLTNLERLDLSYNQFSGIVPPHLWSLTKLEYIDLSQNDLTSSTIDSLFNMSTNHVAHSLTTLDLERNKLKSLPSSIWQLSNLEDLFVSFNSLEDTITEADLTKLPNLKVLYLSWNSLTLDISPDWTPPFQLREIGLSGCKLGPHFPLWLQTQTSFTWLDLSVNDISAEMPTWFSSLSHQVYSLNLSHNQLSGTISDFSSTLIESLDLSYNKFSGPIPSLLSPDISTFQISQNMFSGSLSFNCSNPYRSLVFLDLSSNQLSGKLPNCWENMTRLFFLNLSNNSFSGEIPHALGNLSELGTLHLSNNNFSGELPSTLKNCKYLRFIDIGDNMLTGRIPTWVGEYYERMAYLIIRNNKFHGSIPPQICHLSRIRVLDFSGNNISGKIPPCFHNFTYLVENNITSNDVISGITYSRGFRGFIAEFIEHTIVNWKRKESECGTNLMLLKLIDLSSNRLMGNIPRSFSSLKGLISLNLSRNRLTGIIDPDIGQMGSLNSLDLSSNRLSGAIPISLGNIYFLGLLDLANNNLSGKIPLGRQLQTFPASAYAGNIGLCGNPLPPCYEYRPDPSTNKKSRNVDDGGILSLSFLKEFGISIILGFIFGFWVVVGSLIVKKSWRRMFYNFFGAVGDWLYVRGTLFWTKLFRRS